jgi:hypothetical protein
LAYVKEEESGGRKREPRKTKASAGALLRPIAITL